VVAFVGLSTGGLVADGDRTRLLVTSGVHYVPRTCATRSSATKNDSHTLRWLASTFRPAGVSL